MPALGIRILNFALFGACCFEAAAITNDVIAGALEGPPRASVEARAQPADARADWSERQVILERNLFGAQLAGGEAPVEEIVEEDFEETKLPLSLRATIAADGGSSRAAIFDTRTRKSQVLRLGDSLDGHPQVTITRIERGRVLLLNRGRREELRLAEPSNLPARSPRRSSRAPARRSPRASRNVAPETPRNPAVMERLSELSDLVESGELDLDELNKQLGELESGEP